MPAVVNSPVIHPEDWPYKRLLCVITFGTCYLFPLLYHQEHQTFLDL